MGENVFAYILLLAWTDSVQRVSVCICVTEHRWKLLIRTACATDTTLDLLRVYMYVVYVLCMYGRTVSEWQELQSAKLEQ